MLLKLNIFFFDGVCLGRCFALLGDLRVVGALPQGTLSCLRQFTSTTVKNPEPPPLLGRFATSLRASLFNGAAELGR
ncbi:MAG: hypothetical protein VXZ35_07700, partial [Pseudomonadota bacterium]|nr:hypothetical protein [Pseudomonadota bacterium]